MTDTKTENLTITITDIPSELMDLLWKAMDKTAKQKYDESVKRTSQMSFDFYEMEDNAVTKLIGTAISMHFTQFIKNK